MLRLLRLDDASELARLAHANRDHLAPWEPLRDADHYTTEGQRDALESALSRHEQRLELPYAILGEDDRIVGRVTISGIAHGPFQSGNLGYWVSHDVVGRGVATTAVRGLMQIAFDDVGLHRIQAGTLIHNEASQRVLVKAGFEQIGLARAYLRIAGEWRDHLLYQALCP